MRYHLPGTVPVARVRTSGECATAFWYEGPPAAFDTETTGVDTERDRIVAAALVAQPAPDRPLQIRRWLVDPGVPVPGAASDVHGLSAEHLRAHGRCPGPVVEELARALTGPKGPRALRWW